MTALMPWADVSAAMETAANDAKADTVLDGRNGPIVFVGTEHINGTLNGEPFAQIGNLSGVLCRAEFLLTIDALGYEMGVGYDSARVAMHVAQVLAKLHLEKTKETT